MFFFNVYSWSHSAQGARPPCTQFQSVCPRGCQQGSHLSSDLDAVKCSTRRGWAGWKSHYGFPPCQRARCYSTSLEQKANVAENIFSQERGGVLFQARNWHSDLYLFWQEKGRRVNFTNERERLRLWPLQWPTTISHLQPGHLKVAPREQGCGNMMFMRDDRVL